MIPLTLAPVGMAGKICKVTGNPDVRRHLEDMGFTAGTGITVISAMGENLIVNVKNVRIALSQETAKRIMMI